MPRARRPSDLALLRLRELGLRYPGAHTKSPWPGHLDLAVNDKTFAYLSLEGDPFSISCKLPRSCAAALMLPFTEPTAYGLGKSGWVTAKFADGEALPVEMLEEWLEESYRAQAPKRLVAALDAAGGNGAGGRARVQAKSSTKAMASTNARADAKKPGRAEAKAPARKKSPR